jgi:hypothetical protein
MDGVCAGGCFRPVLFSTTIPDASSEGYKCVFLENVSLNREGSQPMAVDNKTGKSCSFIQNFIPAKPFRLYDIDCDFGECRLIRDLKVTDGTRSIIPCVQFERYYEYLVSEGDEKIYRCVGQIEVSE